MNKTECYLTHFDNYFENSIFFSNHPLLSSEYKFIRNQFIELAEYDTEKEPLTYISDLLNVDAKLQILYELCHCLEALSLNDNEVISIVNNDSKYYYLENFGKTKNETSPYSLLFINNYIGQKKIGF